MDGVDSKDLLKYGLIPELIGRLPVIVTLDNLTKELMIRILSEPKNSLTAEYKQYFKLDGIDLVFEDDVLGHIADQALKKGWEQEDCSRFWPKCLWMICLICQVKRI